MSDIKDILGCSRAAPRSGTPVEAKPKKEKMQRPAGMSREAFALLGDSHPIISTHFAGNLKKTEMKTKPKPSTKGIPTWQYKPFKNSARSDGLELSRWCKCFKDANGRMKEAEEGKEDYAFAKYNKKVCLGLCQCCVSVSFCVCVSVCVWIPESLCEDEGRAATAVPSCVLVFACVPPPGPNVAVR